MTEDVDLALKRPATLILTITEKVLMVMVDVDIGIRTATISTIIYINVVDYWVYLLLLVMFTKVLMVTKEVILVANMEVVDLGL